MTALQRGLRLGLQFFAEDGGSGGAGTTNDTTTTTATTSDSTQQAQTQQTHSQTDIEKLIQSAVDRATQKIGTENKSLKKELETLKNEKLSDEERKSLEEKQRKEELDKRDKDITDRENRLFAISALKEAGLDDGSKESLDLVNLVMGDTEDVIKEKVKALGGLVKRLVESEVNKTFKSNGRTPEKGNTDTKSNENNVAINLGKKAAERNKQSSDVLNHYVGGNK